MSRATLWAGMAGVGAAFLGSLCCAGPLLFVTLGVGAGLASTFEPLRPVLGAVMLGLFGLAFYSVYGRHGAPRAVGRSEASSAVDGEACAAGAARMTPRNRAREVGMLWVAAVIALVLWTFPTWSRLLV
jgi:mercuric ion transport protein